MDELEFQNILKEKGVRINSLIYIMLEVFHFLVHHYVVI